jgi:tetratricopeptide (TPR) repeat protein
MRKQLVLCIYCGLLLFSDAFARKCQSDHFVIYSDLDPCYVQFIRANAEAYYKNLQERYFQTGWEQPLTIYYSKTQSDTQQLLNKNGHKIKVDDGFYDSDTLAVYTHQFMNDGVVNGWGTIFHEITHHFIHLNYRDCPAWFNEGLACFLGEQTQIVKGKLTVGNPSPSREQILRNNIEQGRRPNIRRLCSSSKEQFNEWDLGCHFSRALFYWLHERGLLEQYLTAVRTKGYELSVLEETVSDTFSGINVDLLKFIKKDCYAGAYLLDGRQAKDELGKIQAFLKALELKPNYQAARLELAECYYQSKDYEKCRENLKQILNDPESIEYQQAANMMANTYYNEKDYSKAREYYNKAWEYSDCYEYKYRIAYQIGNCCYHLKDTEGAMQWYKKFLDWNWEPEKMKTAVDYAHKYLGCTTARDANQSEYDKNTQIEANSVSTTSPM